MPTLFGVYASIRVNGKDLPQFKIEFDEVNRTAYCCIPSQAGRNYSVFWKQEEAISPYGAICGRIYFDGSNKTAEATVSDSIPGKCVERTGATISATEELPFVFADVILTDNPNAITASVIPSDIGTIRLTIQRVHKCGLSKYHARPELPAPLVQHERNRKGGHSTRLGQARLTYHQTRVRTKPYTSSDVRPFVTFIFKYRPASALIHAGIMHPSPALKPTNYARNRECNLDSEEERVQQAWAMKAKNKSSDTRSLEPQGQHAAASSHKHLVKEEQLPIAGFEKGERTHFKLDPPVLSS
ncbi:hypothetical protein FRB96_007741 [Tulasnella sp. 330]|nr:hypothetical protein FRB96_007741 [Tulasnella sp. 330]KAG8874255.1 hypothetical protein FRB97_006052 [Tulasnella sp. 331]